LILDNYYLIIHCVAQYFVQFCFGTDKSFTKNGLTWSDVTSDHIKLIQVNWLTKHKILLFFIEFILVSASPLETTEATPDKLEMCRKRPFLEIRH